MMKLADLNKNNIDMANSRTIGNNSFEYSVPMTQKQSRDINIDSDSDEELDADIDGINKSNKQTIDLISMVNSWVPKRNLPDIRKTPNTANVT